MALAALIISILAALFTGWQAIGQHRVSKIERERRHDEKVPRFIAEVRKYQYRTVLFLQLESPWPLDDVKPASVKPLIFFEFAFTDEPGFVWRGLKQGDFEMWTAEQRYVSKLEAGDGIKSLEIKCSAGKEEWKVFTSAEYRIMP